MNQDQLYLLKPHFPHEGNPYFCPGCAELLGLLEYYPSLKQQLDVRYVDFARPRPQLVSLLGGENQSCPVLILGQTPELTSENPDIRHANGRSFIEGARNISSYLAQLHGTGLPF